MYDLLFVYIYIDFFFGISLVSSFLFLFLFFYRPITDGELWNFQFGQCRWCLLVGGRDGRERAIGA